MIISEPTPNTLAARAATMFTRFRGGEQAQLDELVELLTPMLWHTARAQRLDRESAEDVVQTTWLALVRGAHSVADPQAVLQWLIVTTRREAWRTARRGDRVEPREFEADDVVAAGEDEPEARTLRTDADRILWRHIAALPERCRALLRVIAFADRPDYGALARELGMPVGSIGPTRGRCLAKLRLALVDDSAWEAS